LIVSLLLLTYVRLPPTVSIIIGGDQSISG